MGFRFCSTHAGNVGGLCPTGADAVSTSFGRMARCRAAPPLGDSLIHALALTMNGGLSNRDGDPLPPAAGYTYLGQFIDHDLSLDRTALLVPAAMRAQTTNHRTPAFDLDCLYGGGPEVDGWLYDEGRVRLKVGEFDLARRRNGRGILRDRRNDSNRIVSQLHRDLARFHNRVVDELGDLGTKPPLEAFERARAVVTRHYQWIVLYDYLPTIVGREVVDAIVAPARCGGRPDCRLYRLDEPPRMPYEFSAAAFRHGHSMVRSTYVMGPKSGQVMLFDDADSSPTAHDLRGFRPLDPRFAVDWALFFDDQAQPGLRRAQRARPIDTSLAKPLFRLPRQIAQDETDKGRILPYRNLARDEQKLFLPTGQELAEWMSACGVRVDHNEILGRGTPLTIRLGELVGSPDNLGGTGVSLAELQDKLQARAPLWYYVLKEAEHFHAGQRLGKVGGRIVAEVVVGLLYADRRSILRGGQGWRPRSGQFGCHEDGAFGILDLLRHADGSRRHTAPPSSQGMPDGQTG